MDMEELRNLGARKLPIGIQSFESIRRDGYLYVDKTPYVWRLAREGKAYFLSRPRRFGKSLLVSTLEAYFQGRRDLFDGLVIQTLEDSRGDDAWVKHPIIRFSLAGGNYNSPGGLEDALNRVMRSTADRYGFGEFVDRTVAARFATLIEQLHAATGRRVVVLVDEYDKPLLDTMDVNPAQEELNRRLFKEFFAVLKDEDAHLEFVFFTGVTKFSKVSVFSDLNQLRDISLSEDYAAICGVTQSELESFFAPEIDALAAAQGMARGECVTELARMYDGYHFSKRSEGVYNPFSLLNAFQNRNFGSYWFESGTPTFLFNRLRASTLTAEDLADGVEVRPRVLMDYQADSRNPIPLFYQSGYLTIAGYDRERDRYTLRFPNEEVETGFIEGLIPSVLGDAAEDDPDELDDMGDAIEDGDVDAFMTSLAAILAAAPYVETRALKYEDLWRNEVFVIFKTLGKNVRSEVHSSSGRADCIVETKRFAYIFEFKVDQSPDAALAQIEEKGYAMPYADDPRTVVRVGVRFSPAKRTITEWKVA